MDTTLKIAIVFAVVASASSPVQAQSGAPGFDDAHVHLNDPDAWIGLMDEAGIERAIVFRGRDIDNEGLRRAHERWPDRLYPFLSIGPEHAEFRESWVRDDPSIVAVADSLLASGGYYGIGEISVSHFPAAGFPEADFDPDGRVMHGLLEVAERHRVPVTVHVEITRLRELERLLEAFPDVTVIWAHGGYTPLFLAERLLTRHPNLVYELSARTWVRHPRSPDYTILRDGEEVWLEWIELIERLPDRFLVGTDASLRSRTSDERKISSVQNLLNQLSAGARRKVARDNLERLLGPRRVPSSRRWAPRRPSGPYPRPAG